MLRAKHRLKSTQLNQIEHMIKNGMQKMTLFCVHD